MLGKYRIFVLADTTAGKEEIVLEKLLKYDEVIEGHLISGQYDLLVVVEISLFGKPMFTSVQELAQELVRKIRMLGDVRDTNTIVPFLSMTKHAK